jgi:phosphonate degradation associated HDIG domain protein
VIDLLALYAEKGGKEYGERVTQTAHALQSAALAEAEQAPPPLVVASLLHDIGHLLAKQVDDVDDRHEHIAAGYLARIFGPAVSEPIRLHVDAKRWLCACEPGYFATLSAASVRSLALQGGPFSPEEAAAFRLRPYAGEAIRLRRWDDLAKIPDAKTKKLGAYAALLDALRRAG